MGQERAANGRYRRRGHNLAYRRGACDPRLEVKRKLEIPSLPLGAEGRSPAPGRERLRPGQAWPWPPARTARGSPARTAGRQDSHKKPPVPPEPATGRHGAPTAPAGDPRGLPPARKPHVAQRGPEKAPIRRPGGGGFRGFVDS